MISGMTTSTAAAAGDDRPRLLDVLAGITAVDEVEARHLAFARDWVGGGAPLYRVQPPDEPSTHLVSYFVPWDAAGGRLLLVAHRKAGLWLPPGGHVEPGEDPWTTVRRECLEELGRPATACGLTGPHPLFLTVTRTRGTGPHTDVSLWYVLDQDPTQVVTYDESEFSDVRWWSVDEVRAHPHVEFDPHLGRFLRKLTTTRIPR
jgi:8-oxo-dGTP pyrophosphatase MutT (NUDIX family)